MVKQGFGISLTFTLTLLKNVNSFTTPHHRRSTGAVIGTGTAKTVPLPASPVDKLGDGLDLKNDRSLYNEITNMGVLTGEEGRKSRRDVYNDAKWVKARSPNRIFYMFGNIFRSAILGQVFNEVMAVTAVAGTVVLWNAFIVEGYLDLSGVHHDPLVNVPPYWLMALPMDPFKLSSAALGLLLVFRTNSCYARWWEARGCWGLIINHSRNIMRISTAWTLQGATPENEVKRKKQLYELSQSVWEFPRSLCRHLLRGAEDEEAFQREIRDRLDPDIAEVLIGVRHRPTRALYDLSNSVQALSLPYIKKIEIDKSITTLCDQAGACERILTSPVPLVYTRFTARLLSFWLLTLPLAMYAPFKDSWNHIGLVPASALISFCLFGIEELAVFLEEPFSVLPMHAMTEGIGLSASEFDQWHADYEYKVLDRCEVYGQEVDRMQERTRKTQKQARQKVKEVVQKEVQPVAMSVEASDSQSLKQKQQNLNVNETIPKPAQPVVVQPGAVPRPVATSMETYSQSLKQQQQNANGAVPKQTQPAAAQPAPINVNGAVPRPVATSMEAYSQSLKQKQQNVNGAVPKQAQPAAAQPPPQSGTVVVKSYSYSQDLKQSQQHPKLNGVVLKDAQPIVQPVAMSAEAYSQSLKQRQQDQNVNEAAPKPAQSSPTQPAPINVNGAVPRPVATSMEAYSQSLKQRQQEQNVNGATPKPAQPAPAQPPVATSMEAYSQSLKQRQQDLNGNGANDGGSAPAAAQPAAMSAESYSQSLKQRQQALNTNGGAPTNTQSAAVQPVEQPAAMSMEAYTQSLKRTNSFSETGTPTAVEESRKAPGPTPNSQYHSQTQTVSTSTSSLD